MSTSPNHLKGEFKQHLNQMLEAGVISPVDEATPWINSFVIVYLEDQATCKHKISLD